MSHRKYATYQCLGTDCGASVRMRIPRRTGPKRKPPGWRLTSIRTQDFDTGVVRQVQAAFCSDACLQAPDEDSDLGLRLKRYLEVEELTGAVCYVCVQCEAQGTLVNPAHTPTAVAVPEGWTVVPLIAVDYGSGTVRMSSLPICGAACAKELNPDAPRATQPAALRAELARLFAEIEGDAEGAVVGTLSP